MKIDRLKNDEGQFRCFTVDNTQVSRTGMAKVAAQIPGAQITKRPRFFDDVIFCEFSLNGHRFIIEEAYGDNSTYDVVAPESGLLEMEAVTAHFEFATPIRGGDTGYIAFALLNILVGGIVLILFLKAVFWLFS